MLFVILNPGIAIFASPLFDSMKHIMERDNFYVEEQYHASEQDTVQFLTDDVNNDFIHQTLSFISY